MKMAVDGMYLDNLEEFVNDEGKIVTYRWLSTTLQVHVNQAKQMLFTFVQDQRNKKDNDNLSVTYFIAGLSKPGDGHQVHKCSVIQEEYLDSYKSSLAVVTSSHVYSVQKSKLKDSSALCAADYDSLKDSNKYSAIRCKSAQVRSASELAVLQQTPKTPSSDKVQTNGKVSSASNNQSKPKQAQKTGIAGMFANAAKKSETKAPVQTNDKKPEPAAGKVAPAGKKKGGVMAFFAKQSEKKTESKDDKKEVKNEPAAAVIKNEVSPKKVEPKKTKKTKNTRKHDSDDESKDHKKKRRRIKEDLFDSSDEEEDIDILEDSPPPSPVQETPPQSPTVIAETEEDEEAPEQDSPAKASPAKPSPAKDGGERQRKRRRKLVPKTTMDADGYMVTEKVWESESTDASDVETAPPPAKVPQKSKESPKGKKSPQKKSPPSTGSRKQMSLTSFFKKK